ncbi:MAG: molecular chaperone TorD family protein [Acidimicrobiales bacterium]|jgi:TorA maturation chaperone TorD
MVGTTVSNGAEEHRRVTPREPAREVYAGADRPGVEAILAAVDLLAHFWSRPVTDEIASWAEVRDLEAETDSRISSDPLRDPVTIPGPEDVPALLDEYERLFVGPGQVPCPPYESFWREDVPVDIRRTLMGPCTADLNRLYLELGLQVSSQSVELPDHIAIELEAMAYALSFEETEPIARQILEQHLAQWLPRLCRAVAHEAVESFYRDLAVLTLDWLAAIKGYFALSEKG